MKNWKQLREGAPSFVREPAAKAFWNKSVLLNPKNFSEPTKDDKVFKATNVKGPSGKVHGDAKDEDQSQGYHRPIMFGDYLNHLLSMESLDADGEAFLEAVTEMEDEQFVSFMEEEIPADLAEQMLPEWSAKDQADYDDFKKKREQRPADEKAKDKENAKKTLKAFAKEEAEQVDELMAPSRLPDYVSDQGRKAAQFHAMHSSKQKEPIHNALRAKALQKWNSKLKPGSKKIEDVVGSLEAKREAMKLRKEHQNFSKIISLIK